MLIRWIRRAVVQLLTGQRWPKIGILKTIFQKESFKAFSKCMVSCAVCDRSAAFFSRLSIYDSKFETRTVFRIGINGLNAIRSDSYAIIN